MIPFAGVKINTDRRHGFRAPHGRPMITTTRRGYTLLELLVSMSIVVSVFLIVISVLISVFKENRFRNTQLEATNVAMNVVRYTTGLVRQAQASANGAYPLIAATNSSLTFYSPIGGGTAIQQVRLFLNGTNLQQGVIQPVGNPATYPAGSEVVTTLLPNVRNGSQAVFTYYDGAFTGTQAPMAPISVPNIRLVKMHIVYDVDPAATPAATTIDLMAELRNLKDNY